MSSIEVREFSTTIISFINKNPLPMEVKRLALKDILGQVEDVTHKELIEEIKAREVAQKEAEKGEEE